LGLGPDNNSAATSQDIDATYIKQGHLPVSTVDRLAVLGELGTGGSIIFQDDLETGVLGSEWEVFSSTDDGRILVADDTGTSNGTYALAMDVATAGVFNLNEAVLTLDLSDVEEAILGFSHVSFGDETHLLPPMFEGIFNGDGVAISDDGTDWYTVLTGATTPNGLWDEVEFDVVQLASDAGMELGADFKVKFQQYDNFSRNSDGRGYDNVFVGVQYAEDWYSFTLDANESASLALTQLAGEVTGAEIQVYDEADTLLTEGIAGPENLLNYVDGFVNTSPDTETFYVRVLGNAEQYSLLTVKNAAIGMDLGVNQNITGLEGVIGYVSESVIVNADPDVLDEGEVTASSFEGVVLSDALSGFSVYAVTPTLFAAPTGDKVFSDSADRA
ncbi:MAG: hypothetical protein GY904_34055, partial [Planctomycetaceae bacterium]|nr:hypothetical protein [Planctomycetaceae bacterium]